MKVFRASSRYHNQKIINVIDQQGREIPALSLRRIPSIEGKNMIVRAGDRLDIISQQLYNDPTKFWHIADANTELDSTSLTATAGQAIKVPEAKSKDAKLEGSPAKRFQSAHYENDHIKTYRNSHLSHPLRIGLNRRPVRVTSVEEHIKDELEQLFLTTPGERLFLPEFGVGLQELIYKTLDESNLALAKTALTEKLAKWLGNRIIPDELELKVENGKINLKLRYSIRETNESWVLDLREGV
jgi:phage baseplate assembly protein W